MQRRTLAGLAAAAVFSVTTSVAAASTFTVGSVVEPNGATPQACSLGGVLAQTAGPTGGNYTLPAGGEVIRWQTDADGAVAGTGIDLVAMAPLGGGLYLVDAVDPETIPDPASGVATFTPSSPMMVSAGDSLGLYGDSGATCLWSGGQTAPSDVSNVFVAYSPVPGEAFESAASGPGAAVNFSATVVATEDSAVTTSVQPRSVAAGSDAVLSATVTDRGPASNPLTVTDHVPAGMKIDTTADPWGSCAVERQQVTCTLFGLTSGQRGTVDIVVTPRTGSYTNHVRVTQPTAATDPVRGNDTATAKLVATDAVVARCHVTGLSRLPMAAARKLLRALGCRAGRVTRSHSDTVAAGDVIGTTPGDGSYPSGRAVAIVVSSGRRA